MSKPLAELPTAPDLTTPDGLRQHTLEITKHLNELALRQSKGRLVTEDEWNSVDDGIKKLGARTQTLDEMLKSQAASFPGGPAAFTINRAALRLDMPEDMRKGQRDYFNLAVLRWDEVAGLSHLGSEQIRAIGMTRNVAEAGGSNSYRMRDILGRFQTLNDELLVLDVLMHPGVSRNPDLNARLQRMQSYKSWPEYGRLVNELCDAMKVERAFNETTTTAGLNWVPTVLSSQLMDLVQVWSKVAPLFTPITMTSKTLDWPVLGADLVAYLQAESTGDGTGTSATVSTATTNKVTFSAVKMGVRTYASSEVLEDSIVPMVPFVISNAAKVLARGIEDAIINGDIDAAMDGATFNPAGGVRRAWDGLRSNVFETASYPAKTDAGAAAVSEAFLLDVQFKMSNWGASPGPLAWITGFHGFKSMMKLPSVITLEKFGPQASILSGQVAGVFGSPVILSEFVTEKNATGVHDAVGTNNVKGTILCVHRESYGLATRRGINVNGSSDRHIEIDQVIFVATARNDFKPFYTPSATVTPVGAVYNIT